MLLKDRSEAEQGSLIVTRAKRMETNYQICVADDILDDSEGSYVPAEQIKDLMWGYLALKKNYSQRSLAQRVLNDMKAEGKNISLESIQRIFSKEAKKAPAIIKDILIRYFAEAGLTSPNKIWFFIRHNKQDVMDEFSLIASDEVNKLALVWIAVNPTKSKRLLAMLIKKDLDGLGYDYHLGSLQNILSGKIKETKKVVYKVLRGMLMKEHFRTEENLTEALTKLPEESLKQYEVISADELVLRCDDFLQANPLWTKRKLSIQLAHDLGQKGYKISFNSLQYALGGKRCTVKKILLTTLEDYLKTPPHMDEDIFQSYETRRNYTPKRNLAKLFEMVTQSLGTERHEELTELYYKAREAEIKRLWNNRLKKKEKRLQRKISKMKDEIYLPLITNFEDDYTPTYQTSVSLPNYVY